MNESFLIARRTVSELPAILDPRSEDAAFRHEQGGLSRQDFESAQRARRSAEQREAAMLADCEGEPPPGLEVKTKGMPEQRARLARFVS